MSRGEEGGKNRRGIWGKGEKVLFCLKVLFLCFFFFFFKIRDARTTFEV